MDFIKRSFIYLRTKIGRTFLVLLALTTILSFVLSGIIVNQAAVEAGTNVSNGSGTEVTLSTNRTKILKQTSGQAGGKPNFSSLSEPQVPITTVKKLAKSNLVSGYQAYSAADVTADNFKAVSTTNSTSTQEFTGNKTQTTSTGNITISGVSTTASSTNFSSKEYSISAGRGIKSTDINSNSIVIESELAKTDSLKVGDSITVKNSSGKVTSLKIVGIYKAKTTSPEMGAMPSDPSNTIYSSYTLASNLSGYTNKVTSATFTVSNSSKTTVFIDNSKKYISSKLSLISASNTYKETAQSMKSIEKFADKIVWIVAIAGTVILTLVVVILTRDRRQEMGILMSMGENKISIFGQFLLEMTVILIASLALSGVFGSQLGNKFGTQLLAQQEKSQTTLSTSAGAPGGGQAGNTNHGFANINSTKNYLSKKRSSLKKLDTHVSLNSLLKLGGLGFVIVALATLIGSLPILNLRPREILTKN